MVRTAVPGCPGVAVETGSGLGYPGRNGCFGRCPCEGACPPFRPDRHLWRGGPTSSRRNRQPCRGRPDMPQEAAQVSLAVRGAWGRGRRGGEAAPSGGLYEDGIRSDGAAGADVATTARWLTDAADRRDNRTSSAPAAGMHHRGLGPPWRRPDHVRSRRTPPLHPACVGLRPSAILGPCHAAISLTLRRNALPRGHPRVAASGGAGPANCLDRRTTTAEGPSPGCSWLPAAHWWAPLA
ncbi:hypothetical protein J2W80_006122 [Methylorubrum extorquens]|nr:hypothetical protein [Methylorubrum extorquens]MCP1590897.1 hypothetical protein [Methylorubrum extorquens]